MIIISLLEIRFPCYEMININATILGMDESYIEGTKNSKIMKQLSILVLLIWAIPASAQYCMPQCKIYFNTMPGITNVSLQGINRTSDDCEGACATNGNNFVTVNTTKGQGHTAVLVRGQSYPFSMTYTIDAPICPDMNLRAYIDYDQNFFLDDPGETIISANNQLPGTYTTNITIPSGASLGVTRFRVLAKMTSNGGHTPPTPCNVPPDPIDFHGEMEDFEVTIVNATAVEDLPAGVVFFSALPSGDGGGIEVHFSLEAATTVTLTTMDMTGKVHQTVFDGRRLVPGHYSSGALDGPAAGIYLVRLQAGGSPLTRKVTVSR